MQACLMDKISLGISNLTTYQTQICIPWAGDDRTENLALGGEEGMEF